MIATLTDRYVAAVLRHVSCRARPQLERELRAVITSEIDERIALGESTCEAEYSTLEDLGDPRLLATHYADRATVLISPETYPDYARALRWAVAVCPPVAYTAAALDRRGRGASASAALVEPLRLALTMAAYLAVAVTAWFVLVDRVRADRPDGGWTPDALLPASARTDHRQLIFLP
ncbi:hypothetical protein [Amycolatopsis sp. BJA-103]|uniref:hypothetical protein n=1 Tax=Amycolatopsis sp. BJA-103 TaxID=1911175 RepID=UPI000C764041|nr:hypothetical protein [Amycolatopsis sp. BJA-103]AUI58383.1 hypothetical protein BKN51_09225 [Amycolatopsis sp. BJA-103]PNE14753.1 hypothetical protein B1H26_32885 [Amycolatopsis sp. BJA-103]